MGSGPELLGGLVRSVAADQPTPRRVRLVARAVAESRHGDRSLAAHCEVGAMLARRAGLTASVVDAWPTPTSVGTAGGAGRARGDAIPLAVRVSVVARDADLATMLGADLREWLRARSGRAYDPSVVAAASASGTTSWPSSRARTSGRPSWQPSPSRRPRSSRTLDAVLVAFADFADLKSPWIRGHSRRVASLAEEAGRHAGLDNAARDGLRRAGLVHDLGRVAVENGIWDKAGPLTTSEWERVRLHPHYTERILARCGALASLVRSASSHHERIDGSGYHRAVGAESLTREDRILAAADVYAALTAARPHRAALAPDAAARVLEADSGLDADAVGCVLAAAGRRAAPACRRPAASPTARWRCCA